MLNVALYPVRNGAYTRQSYLLLFGVLCAFSLLLFFCSMRLRETCGHKIEVS